MIKKSKRKKSFSSPLSNKVNLQYLLEHGTTKDLVDTKDFSQKLIKYHWDYYYELARQRNEIMDKIKTTLVKSSSNIYKFKQWQRAVKYKYGLHPFSAQGSHSFIGGRFNFGKEINSEIHSFSALYLAKNKDTALQEHLGQEVSDSRFKLSAREAALTNPSSETIVSVSGQLDKIFDLTEAKNLIDFVKLIKNFTISKILVKTAKNLNLPEPKIIKTHAACFKNLLDANWRNTPNNFDIPANSQIFGHLVYMAEIEGILYSSKFANMPCMVLFPSNFKNTESFLTLDDEAPHRDVPIRIDSKNWHICDLNFEELIKGN